ncbi:RimJ/RimL family protein N-acetyltransferase [Kitasatospora sp. MAP12-15]|uniref:GNAT family N-acetyltransferase n=1 Tax=unclassified Kitasatospora TaxID=2633591 RepID=UPI002475574E|nr:GNAT family N-acetyltransferase [Kitasatospora sp. MAP12-44]MDH6108880.1 RimJ/RimL family protein N-acetyltransferase [Kitasatospora sp. MAP12-44]
MTAVPTSLDLAFRPISGPEEVELFNRLDYVFNHEVVADLASGSRRAAWSWVALDAEGRLLARVAWWCRPQGTAPLLLDIFDYLPGQDAIGAALLRTALAAVVPVGSAPPKYSRFLPADWRADPAVRSAVEGRFGVLEELGARLFVERLRLQWTSGTPVPAPTGRLAFRPVDGEAELVDLLSELLTDTLDVYSLDDLSRMTARQTAQSQYDDEFAGYSSPRDWWRVAILPETGEPVGLVIAARNQYRPIIAYIGVLPAHRGRGYIDDILAEGTRVLATTAPECIRASTDVGNVPMAAAFARAGYDVFERELLMTWA